MLNFYIAIFLLVTINLQAFEVNSKNNYFTKNKNVLEEIKKAKKNKKEISSSLEKIFNKNVEKYLTEKLDFKDHFITNLFKYKYEKFKFSQEVLQELELLQLENIKKARKKIKLSDDVMAYMNIGVLTYFKSIEIIKKYREKLIEKNMLKEVECSFNRQNIYACFEINLTNDTIFREKLEAGEVYFKEINNEIVMSLTDISPKSGSVEETDKVRLLRMSFFMNGVILDQGDF